MPITLVTGPIRSGKTAHLFEVMSKKLCEEAAIILVPNETLARDMRERFLATQVHGILGNPFMAVDEFLIRMTRSEKHVLTHEQQILLCFRLLGKLSLRYFHRDALSLSIATEAAETITTLKSYGVSSVSLEKMLSTRGTLKEFDLLTLFRAYEKEIDDLQVLDHGDLALTHLPQRLSHIAFDEFFPFSPREERLVKALMYVAPKLDIFITAPISSTPDDLFGEEANKNLAYLTSLADRIVEQKEIVLSEALVHVVAVRSPQDQTRLIVHEMLGERGDAKKHITLCTRAPHRAASSVLTAFRHPPRRVLSLPFASHLPVHGTLKIFCKTANGFLERWERKQSRHTLLAEKNSQPFLARNISFSTHLRTMLHHLAVSDSEFAFGDLSQTTFNELVQQCIFRLQGQQPLEFFHNILALRSFEQGCAHASDRIILADAWDDVFPTNHRNRLFFTDPAEMGVVPNTTLDRLFPTTEAHSAYDAWRFQKWIASAREEVLVIVPSVDERGKETTPSPFLHSFDPPLPVDGPLLTPKNMEHPKVREHIETSVAIARERRTGEKHHLEYHGIMTSPQARALLRKRFTHEPFSPSRLEIYAECPFRFFLECVLGLEPDEEITPEISPKDRGTIIHFLLEQFWKKRRQPHQLRKLVEQAYAAHPDLLRHTAKALHPFEHAFVHKIISDMIARECEEQQNFPKRARPTFTEWSFGDDASSALTIPIPGGPPALIRGRIDRIDTTPGKKAFLIVDYKTGRHITSIRHKMIKGKHFQLPLYVEAVRRLLLPKAEPLGGILFEALTAEKRHGFLKKHYNGVYYRVSTRSGTLVDDEEWSVLINSALHAAAHAITCIRAGNFSTRSASPCAHCHFAEVCQWSTR